jgi:hypothetical protein
VRFDTVIVPIDPAPSSCASIRRRHHRAAEGHSLLREAFMSQGMTLDITATPVRSTPFLDEGLIVRGDVLARVHPGDTRGGSFLPTWLG